MFGVHSGTRSGESSPSSSKFLPFSSSSQSSLCTDVTAPALPAAPKSTTGNAQSALIWDCPSQYLFSYYPEESEFAIPPAMGLPAVQGAPCACPGREDSLEVHRCCPLLPPHHQHSTSQRKTIKSKSCGTLVSWIPSRGSLQTL